MIELTDIHSLTDFLRNHKAHVERLKEAGRPQVLTINGKAEIVIQSAEAYQKLLEQLDYTDAIQKLGKALDRMRNGEPGIPADQVLAELRKKLSLPAS